MYKSKSGRTLLSRDSLNLNLNTKELAGSLLSSLCKSGNEVGWRRDRQGLNPEKNILLSFNGGEVTGEVMMSICGLNILSQSY
jgi:hypothetical protein